ncbi:MAG: 50S ribosomal protein L4 [Bdellovibrionaceae bacterium]|nr:50S ribosomal protein L4 [Pseudobdellovibrionaceae bacterium]
MASVDVLGWDKKKVGSVELEPSVFDITVKKEILQTVVRWQLACRRQGTHKAKTRGEVSGGGKKPFKQKGTGNARQGSIRSPLMPGGGIAFGPEPRDYSYVLPKKVKRLGLRTALSFLKKEGRLFVVDAMTSTDGKTKDLAKKLEGFGLKKAVLIDSAADDKFNRASRNLPKFRYTAVEGMNVYDLLKYDNVIIAKGSIDAIIERCSDKRTEERTAKRTETK